MRLAYVAVAMCIVALSGKGMACNKANSYNFQYVSDHEARNNNAPCAWTPVSFKYEAFRSETGSQPQANQEDSNKWTEPIVLVTAAYVIVSFLTLLAIKRQGVFMAKQVELLDKQVVGFIEGQRPKLVADPHGNPARDALSDDFCRVKVKIKNVGLTTASHVLYESWIEIVKAPFAGFSSNADHYIDETPMTLYPNHRGWVLNIPYRKSNLNDAIKGLIRTGKFEICVRVSVVYRDAFDPKVRVAFGYIVDADGFRVLPDN